MGPSPDRLKDVKPFKIKCAGRSTLPAIRSDDLYESEALRRALGTVPQLLEKRSGNYKPTQDDAADEGLMKSKPNESELETKPEARKTEEADKDRRKSSAVNPRTFDGSKPVESFLQIFRACAQYYKWTEEENSVQMKCAISGDAATLSGRRPILNSSPKKSCKNFCERDTAQLSRDRKSVV